MNLKYLSFTLPYLVLKAMALFPEEEADALLTTPADLILRNTSDIAYWIALFGLYRLACVNGSKLIGLFAWAFFFPKLALAAYYCFVVEMPRVASAIYDLSEMLLLLPAAIMMFRLRWSYRQLAFPTLILGVIISSPFWIRLVSLKPTSVTEPLYSELAPQIALSILLLYVPFVVLALFLFAGKTNPNKQCAESKS